MATMTASVARKRDMPDIGPSGPMPTSKRLRISRAQPQAASIPVQMQAPMPNPPQVRRRDRRPARWPQVPTSHVQVAGYWRSGNTYDVAITIGGRKVFFARAVPTEAQAERLAREVQRISKQHSKDVAGIREELGPIAQELGVKLTVPPTPLRNYKTCGDGSYEVSKVIDGRRIYFATHLSSEATAMRLASEVQHFFQKHGSNVMAIRRSLHPILEELGVELPHSQSNATLSKNKLSSVLERLPEVDGRHKLFRRRDEQQSNTIPRRLTACGRYNVKKRVQGKLVYFATRVYSKAKAMRLATEVQRLVGIHGDDVDAIRNQLQPVADEVGVKLTVPQGKLVGIHGMGNQDGEFDVTRNLASRSIIFAKRNSPKIRTSDFNRDADGLFSVGKLKPTAEELGLNLEDPARDFKVRADGMYNVRKRIGGRLEYFATSISSKDTAERLASEVQRLSRVHGEDLLSIRGDLQPVAEQLGVELSPSPGESLNYFRKCDGTYVVGKLFGKRHVTFATGIISKPQAEQLASELQRLAETHHFDVPAIRRDLKPIAKDLGLELIVPQRVCKIQRPKAEGEAHSAEAVGESPGRRVSLGQVPSYFIQKDGRFEVRTKINGVSIFFARGIVSEIKARRLGNEVQRLALLHRDDVAALRADLHQVAEELGVTLTGPRREDGLTYYQDSDGFFRVCRLMANRRITFANTIGCEIKAAQMGRKVQQLVQIHGADPTAIRRELQPIAQELGLSVFYPTMLKGSVPKLHHRRVRSTESVSRVLNGKIVIFATDLSSEQKAKKLANEIEHLVDLHGEDVTTIWNELQPVADSLGVQLAMPWADGQERDCQYDVSDEEIAATAVGFTSGVASEQDCPAKDPGIKITVRKGKSASSSPRKGRGETNHKIVDESRSSPLRWEYISDDAEANGGSSASAVEGPTYSKATDGTYTVFKDLGGRRVYFAVNVPTEIKAEQLAQEIDFLVQLHGADVASICEELQLVADELGVRLVAQKSHAA